MAEFNPIGDSEYIPGAPLNTSLFSRIIRNPEAMFEGAPGAPRVHVEAFGGVIEAGDVAKYHDTSLHIMNAGSTQRLLELQFLNTGSVRVSAELYGLNSTNPCRVYVYHNGAEVAYWYRNNDSFVTYSVDITLAKYDRLHLIGYGAPQGSSARYRNLKLSTTGGRILPIGHVAGDACYME